VRGQTPHPALSPLRARKARQSGKKLKNQLRSTTVSTPPRLLMTAIKSMDQSLFLESLVHLTSSPLTCHQLLVRIIIHLTSQSVFSLPYAALIRDSRCYDGLHPRDNHYLSPAISAASMHCSHILHSVQSLRLWVYHRDFGATLSVIYGK
jgi:hypothetical protein